MINSFSPAVRHLCARYRTQADVTRRTAHEAHDLRSLSQRVLLSSAETLEQVAAGNLISLDCRNNKYLFSSRSLDAMRNRVVDHISGIIVEELGARGFSEDRILMALSRAFQKQFDLSRGQGENIVEFARTPQDDDDDDFYNGVKTAAGVGAAGLAGYGAYKGYKYLKNRGNGTATLPGPGGDNDGSGPQSAPVPGGGGPRTPRDPNSSAVGVYTGTSGNGAHPGPPAGGSLPVPVTTASSTTRKTIGNSVVDPLADAVASGRRAVAKKGSAIWQILRGIPLD